MIVRYEQILQKASRERSHVCQSLLHRMKLQVKFLWKYGSLELDVYLAEKRLVTVRATSLSALGKGWGSLIRSRFPPWSE